MTEEQKLSVLRALATYKVMPFLELSYVSDVVENDLDEIVKKLQNVYYVEVSGEADERMVNLTDLGLKVVRHSKVLKEMPRPLLPP